MEHRTLDLTIISANDLKKVSLLGKPQMYALAWIKPHPQHGKHRTLVDKSGSTNPEWNQTFSLTIPEQAFQHQIYRLVIEIYDQCSWGDTFVGAVYIPVTDFLGTGSTEILTYEVKRRSGQARGSLRLSASLGEKIPLTTPSINGGKVYGSASASEPVMAYPPFGSPATPVNAGKIYGSEPVMAYPEPVSYSQPYPAPQQYPYPSYAPQQGYPMYPPPPLQGYYPPAMGYGPYASPQAYTGYAYPSPHRRPGLGGMGMGLGTGLLAGALGGLLVGELVDDAFDGGGYGGGFDGSFGGGF